MAQLAAQAQAEGWNDAAVALAWSTQVPKMQAEDELDEPLVRQEAFLDGVAVGRALPR
jgi:hypothetical protein